MNGDSAQAFLVDGLAAGTWRVEDGQVAIEPFGTLSRSDRAELENERARLKTFLGDGASRV